LSNRPVSNFVPDARFAFGWGPLDRFGCDQALPFARVDHTWGRVVLALERARPGACAPSSGAAAMIG